MGHDIDKLIAEVERLDREATPGPWGVTKGAYDIIIEETGDLVAPPGRNRREVRANGTLIATFRSAAPTLADEVQRLNAEVADAHRREAEALRRADAASASLAAVRGEVRDLRAALTFADQQGAEAIERVSTAIVNDKWNATAAFQDRALKAEKERDALHDRIEGALAAALGNPVMSIHDGDGPVADSLESLIALVASEHASVKRIRAERDKLRRMVDAMDGSPWFVVHQRDGRPQLDVFSGDGAEHAAKMRARDHATNWSEVYIMRGVEVHGGDFEDEAMVERARETGSDS